MRKHCFLLLTTLSPLSGMHIFKYNNKHKKIVSLIPLNKSETFKNNNTTETKKRKSIHDPLKDKNVHYFFGELRKTKDAKKLYRKWMLQYHPDAGVYEDKQYAQEQTVKINRAKKAFDEGSSLYEDSSSCHNQENYYSDGHGYYAGWWGCCSFSASDSHFHINMLHLRLGRLWLAFVVGSFAWEFLLRDNISIYDNHEIMDIYKNRKWKIRDDK